MRDRCREAAGRTAWRDLYSNYLTAYQHAFDAVQERSKSGVVQFRLPKRSLPSPGSGTKPRMSAFEASATLPQSLRGLERLARNFWWVWNAGARDLFEELAPGFKEHDENPVAFLASVNLETLERRSVDKAYLKRVKAVCARLDEYMATANGVQTVTGDVAGAALSATHPVAYFSAEFAVHHTLPIYSGGLGILAGDHLKVTLFAAATGEKLREATCGGRVRSVAWSPDGAQLATGDYSKTLTVWAAATVWVEGVMGIPLVEGRVVGMVAAQVRLMVEPFSMYLSLGPRTMVLGWMTPRYILCSMCGVVLT